MRISFSSRGVDRPEQFNARTMISNARILFRPKAEVRSAIREGIYYENAGVRADGTDYPSIAAYRRARGDRPAAGTGGRDE